MVNISDECLVFHIFRLRTMTDSTWEILKLDRKTPGFFSSKRVGTHCLLSDMFSAKFTVCQVLHF